MEAQEKLRQKGKAKNKGQRSIRSWLLEPGGGAHRKEDREGVG